MRCTHLPSAFLFVCAASLLAQPLAAQTIFDEVRRPADMSQFGCALVSLDDVDGDGVRDLAVTSCDRSVHIFSSAHRRVLRSFDASGYSAGGYHANYGLKLASLGDIDGDGFGDLAIGQSSTITAGGTIWVVNARTGALIFQMDGDPGDYLAADLAAVGDVNADGTTDLAAYAFNHLISGVELEYVLVWSGASGELLHRFDAPSLQYEYGFGVRGVGDVDGDGHDDVAFGVRNATGGKELHVQSGASGMRLLVLPECRGGAARIGDINADGRDDFAAPAEGSTPGTESLRIFSGDGTIISRVDGFSYVGSLQLAGDLNGDGLQDLLLRGNAGASGNRSLELRSGADGALWNGVEAPWPIDIVAFDGTGDLDGDSVGDIAVSFDRWGPGRVLLLRGGGLVPLERTCEGVPNSTGARATLESSGTLSLLDADLVLTARSLTPETAGIFVRGTGDARFPFGDGVLCISPFDGGLQRFDVVASDAAGVALTGQAAASLGSGASVLAGTTWSFQLIYRDPAGGPARFNTSDALRGAFVP